MTSVDIWDCDDSYVMSIVESEDEAVGPCFVTLEDHEGVSAQLARALDILSEVHRFNHYCPCCGNRDKHWDECRYGKLLKDITPPQPQTPSAPEASP